MKKLTVLLAGLALISSLHAVTGISGVVFNAENRDPIVGATVCCYVANSQTDSSGCYLISDLQPGKYRVRAFATGFQTGYFPESVLVVHGQVTPDIDFALVPNGSPNGGISGRVRNAENQTPISGALITAQGPHGSGSAPSESCGGYIISSLPAGKYRVCAQATGHEPGAYPDSVLVTGGQVVPDIDFALAPSGVQNGGISGRVTNASNQSPIRGAVITAHGPNGHGAVQSESCGGYIINALPAGKYRVCAQAQGFESAVYPDSVEVLAGRTTPDIDFALVPTGGQNGAISGMVYNAQSRAPILGALVVATGPSQAQANSDERGMYCVRDLLPGTYLVRASASGFHPLARDTVEVVAGETTGYVCFGLEPMGSGTGAISGSVKDSATMQGIPGAHVFAWGPAGQGLVVTDSAGNYLLAELIPGDYVVRACGRGYYPVTWPESVHVTEGQTVPGIDFVLCPVRDLDAGIGGFVYDGNAQVEIGGAHVTAIGVSGSFEAFTGAHGDYLVAGLEPGEYLIQVDAPGYGPGLYPDPVTVEAEVVSAFVCPALYLLTGIASPSLSHSLPGPMSVMPNPFAQQALVRWQLPKSGQALVCVYDNSGRLVRTLVDSHLQSGSYTAIWDGRDNLGR